MVVKVSLLSGAVTSDGPLSIQTNAGTEAIGITTGQVVSLAQNPILSGGTINGVAYLNSSKILTTGTGLVFDGTNLGLGVTPSAWANSKAFDIGGFGALSTDALNDANTSLSWNAYATAYNAWKYKNSGSAASKYTQEAGKHYWYTAASGTANNAINFTQAMTLDASGNLGVNNTSPTTLITAIGGSGGKGMVLSGAVPVLYFEDTNGTDGCIYVEDGNIGFVNGTTERARIDSSGNLGVGTPSPARKLDVQGASSGETYQLRLGATTTNSYDIGRSTTDGYFRFYGNQSAAQGYIFGGANGEYARLDYSGNLLVNTTTASLTNTNSFYFAPAPGYGANSVMSHISGTSSGVPYVAFAYNAGVIGNITQAGTTGVLYNVTSDQRLKENIVDAPEFGSVIDSIKVRSFDWITDQTHQRAGFIAQELVIVAPEAVHQPLNEEEMMAVDYSKLVPMLVKEIQSLRQRLAALEAK